MIGYWQAVEALPLGVARLRIECVDVGLFGREHLIDRIFYHALEVTAVAFGTDRSHASQVTTVVL